MSKAFAAIGLTGGGVGDLDSIDGALLSAGDIAWVIDASGKKVYQYTLNATGTASGVVGIAPTANPGTKTWDLAGVYAKDSITLDDGTELGYLQFATAVLELYNAKAASGEVKIYAKDAGGNKEVTLACAGGGAVTLYYDNASKLATSSAGVTVTGTLTASTGVTITGTALSINGVAQGLDVTAALNRKIIEIGDWDMDAAATLTVAHGLTFSKIRTVQGMIRNDANDTYLPITPGYSSGAAVLQISIPSIDATNVNLERLAGGAFDSTNYNSTSYNRGWIIIDYIN